LERTSRPTPAAIQQFRLRATIAATACALGSLLLFLVLPMQIGNWWYVYPRELTAFVFLALAACPPLPRTRTFRASIALLGAIAPLPMALLVTRNYAHFDASTRDFDAIVRQIPKAPRLLYLIFDHEGAEARVSPLKHLPAYVQAERGGWLSYHFAIYGASPLFYRPREGREDIIPPPTPPLWEETPEKFEVLDRGRFFDWFLVRRQISPAEYFDADPAIEEVSHIGSWWLYHRRSGAPLRASLPPASD
jgi:hypothetical protein